MKQILVELDEETVARLERVAPARSRRRSEFIRMAVQRALWDLEERRVEDAYRRQPDREPVYFDPDVWEKPKARRTRRGR